jgi:hypothetical protein
MRSPWSGRVLLPAAQSLSEGSWLAVVYAALQAAGGEVAYLGPLELGAVVVAGVAWGRRKRLLGTSSDALGLPLLSLVAGLLGWLLDPHVRSALIDGMPLTALSLHLSGWLAGLAFWRGESRRSPEDDAVIEHGLMRWAVPGLAVPWLVGYAVADGQLQDDFAAAAFVGTIFFIGSAFTALGLARLAALRDSTGSDWRGDRSWAAMILGLALVLTVVSVPVAAALGIPARSLLPMVVGPLQTLLLLVVLLTAPVFVAAAFVAGLLRGLLPPDLQFPEITFPFANLGRIEPTSDLPITILSIIVASIFLLDVLVLLALLWFGYRGRRRRLLVDPEFEEREIVPPDGAPLDETPPAAPRPRGWGRADDATGAYLAALDELEADGRWTRRAQESPAAHLARARGSGLESGAFARLAAAYQLVRYGGRSLPERERSRAPSRLAAVRSWLTRR